MAEDAKTMKAPDTKNNEKKLLRIEMDIALCRERGYTALEKALERYKKYMER